MAGVIVLFVFQIFLFGFTSANCDIPCSECKEFSSGPYQGIWSLIETNSPSCPTTNNGNVCLYTNIENGTRMCFCDPGTESYTPCGEWVNGLCYNDSAFPWIEKNFISLSNNSIENCRAACRNNFPTALFYGVEWTTLCFCGTIEQPTPHHLRVNQSFCNRACPGNNLELCGAWNMINLYAINPLIEHPENGLCYNDTSYPWIEQHFISLSTNNSISTCRAACISTYPTSTHFGLEDGNLCACGTEPQPTKQHLQVAQTLCNMPCSANPNPSEFCGGNDMTNLWRINPLY